MTRWIIPIGLVAAAVGLFVLYTNPTYQSIKQLSAQAQAYDDALTKAQQLRATRDQLLSKRNAFSPDDIQKLGRVLPDNVDNIRLIIDINNIAAHHNLSLVNVKLGDVSGSSKPQSAAAVGTSGDPVGSVELGFSVAANYDDFLAFLQDLEHSMRLIDIEKVSFKAGQGDLNTYVFQIRTYWLH